MIHGFEAFESAWPIFRAVEGQCRHRDRIIAEALLEIFEVWIPVVRMEGMAVVAQRRGNHPGLAEGGFEARHHRRGGVNSGDASRHQLSMKAKSLAATACSAKGI